MVNSGLFFIFISEKLGSPIALKICLTRSARKFKKKKPSPFDEAVSLTWYLENVFYNSISNIQKYIKSNIADFDFKNSDLVSLGFWPGGDRDVA